MAMLEHHLGSNRKLYQLLRKTEKQYGIIELKLEYYFDEIASDKTYGKPTWTSVLYVKYNSCRIFDNTTKRVEVASFDTRGSCSRHTKKLAVTLDEQFGSKFTFNYTELQKALDKYGDENIVVADDGFYGEITYKVKDDVRRGIYPLTTIPDDHLTMPPKGYNEK